VCISCKLIVMCSCMQFPWWILECT
jgi:hypothetical protein